MTNETVILIRSEIVKCWTGNPLASLANDAIVHTVCSLITNADDELKTLLHDTVDDPDMEAGFSAVSYHLADIPAPLSLLNAGNLEDLEEELKESANAHRLKLIRPRYMSRFEYKHNAVYLTALSPRKRKKNDD